MSMNPNSDVSHDCGLNNYERNRWFRGKMVTARDLNAEWQYHADRSNTATQFVVGEGIVCGLETTVSRVSSTTLSVEVSPGFGIDSCGRHLVVKRNTRREVDVLRNQPAVSLYLTYRECGKESVPPLGTTNACDDDACEYNRIMEVFDVEAGDPPADDYKRVRSVSFPPIDDFPEGYTSLDDLHPNDDGNAGEDTHPDIDEDEVYHALYQTARSYNETDALGGNRTRRDCDTGKGPLNRRNNVVVREDEPAVFLGTFEEVQGEWIRDEDDPLRFVYTNDMLHDALVDHAVQFDNPHQVKLNAASRPRLNEGLLFAAHESELDPVTLRSSDGSVGFSLTDTRELDLTIPYLETVRETLSTLSEEVSELRGKLPSIERYVLDKTMKYKLKSFGEVAEAFENQISGDIATEIVTQTLTGIDNRMYRDSTKFGTFLFVDSVALVLPSDRVSGQLEGGTLTLTNTQGEDTVSYPIDLSMQEFDASDVNLDGNAVTITTSLFGCERLFAEVLDELATDDAIADYRKALDEFQGLPTPDDPDADVLELAVLQDQLCEAVDRIIETETAADLRPIGRVFLGQTDVDLRGFRAAPDSGTVRLVDVSDPNADGIEVDVAAAAIMSENGFQPGSYAFEGSAFMSVTVIEPQISDLSVTMGGSDVKTRPITEGATTSVVVGSTFNFDEVERVVVTVSNLETNDPVDMDGITTDRFISDRSDSVGLNVSELSSGEYRVTVSGENVFADIDRTETFNIVEKEIRFSLDPTSVFSGNFTTGQFRSFLEENVFVSIPKKSYTDPSALEGRRALEFVRNVFTGNSVVGIGMTESSIFAEIRLDGGNADFKINSKDLQVTGRILTIRGGGLFAHTIRVSTNEDLSSVVASASLRVNQFSIVEPVDPGIFKPDEVIIRPGGGGIFHPGGGGIVRPRSQIESDRAPTFEDIDGIGDVRARRLVGAGVTDLLTLAETNIERLADATDVSPEMAESWREQARNMIRR